MRCPGCEISTEHAAANGNECPLCGYVYHDLAEKMRSFDQIIFDRVFEDTYESSSIFANSATNADSASTTDCTLESLKALMSKIKPLPKAVLLAKRHFLEKLKLEIPAGPGIQPLDRFAGIPVREFSTGQELMDLTEEYRRDGYEIWIGM